MLGVVGVANGAAGVFFALAGLVVLPLVEAALPTGSLPLARPAGPIAPRRSLLVPVGAGALTLALAGTGLAVDRFDRGHPRQAHLLYVLDADTGTAMWASQDREPAAWTAAYVPNPHRDAEPSVPLPYGTTPRWTGAAEVLAADPPRIDLLGSHRARGVTVVKARVASSRQADVIVLHTDRPVEAAIIAAGGQPPVTSSPDSPDDGGAGAWPYELRFYDPPPDGFAVTLRLRGAGAPRIRVSDYTVGLEQVPGFTPRPAGLDRSPDHSSDLVVVGRTFRP